MESSTFSSSPSRSKAIENNKNKNTTINLEEDIAISFGSLCLSSNNISTAAASSPPPLDSSDKLQETQVINKERRRLWPKIDNSQVILDFIPDGTDRLPSSSSLPENNIWACQNFYNGERPTESMLYGLRTSMTSQNYTDMNYAPDNSDGRPRDQTDFNVFLPDSSMCRFGRNSALNFPSGSSNLVDNVYRTGNFSPVMENHVVNDQLFGNISRGYYNRMDNNQASSCNLQDKKNVWNHDSPLESSLPGFNFVAMAMNPEGSEQLIRVIKQGSSCYTQEILIAVFPRIFWLMNHVNGHNVFKALVDKCENCHLYKIVMKLQRQSDIFLNAIFCEFGSKSIQRLIKRLKKTGMELIITSILSTRSYELMTDKSASHVITYCFRFLGDEANGALYEHILTYFLPLASDSWGCITVNACIDSITGPRRAALLDMVASNASFLANDPSGNFVLQRVLGLNYGPTSRRICYSLKGQYVELSKRRCGSHVVEKCLASSEQGLSLVIEEIFKNDKTLLMLARDEFGNYVIQTALRHTKVHAKDVYDAIVKTLKPHSSNLLHKPWGKHVINLIKADTERQSPKFNQ